MQAATYLSRQDSGKFFDKPVPADDAYTVAVREVRNHDVGAMNLLGSRGWEAFAAVRTDRGTLVLLKRPQ